MPTMREDAGIYLAYVEPFLFDPAGYLVVMLLPGVKGCAVHRFAA
jgi:hypothetical protein